jgi:hypothetical protein
MSEKENIIGFVLVHNDFMSKPFPNLSVFFTDQGLEKGLPSDLIL